MKLIGYSRVSTEDQASGGHSLGFQPEQMARWCLPQGHGLVDVIVDGEGEGESFRGVSGGLPLARRQGGSELLRRLKAGEADAVLAISLTRLFRDVDDGRWFFLKFAIPRGIKVFTVSEGHLDPTTVAGWMMINQLLLFGEIERLQAGERTRATAQSLRRAGRVSGTVPYGCVAIDGRQFREPAKWAIREQIVAMRRVDGKSLQAISNELRRARVTAPGGGIRWPKSTIATIVETHHSLTHLPHVADGSTCNTATPEAAVSSEPTHARHH